MLRPRVVIYSIALLVTMSSLAVALSTRKAAEVIILRSSSEPYSVEDDGRVANQLRVKIVNRSNTPQVYTVSVSGLVGGTIIAPELPLTIEANAQRTTSLFVIAPFAAFDDGRHRVTLRVSDGNAFTKDLPFVLLGPAHDMQPEREDRRKERDEESHP